MMKAKQNFKEACNGRPSSLLLHMVLSTFQVHDDDNLPQPLPRILTRRHYDYKIMLSIVITLINKSGSVL